MSSPRLFTDMSLEHKITEATHFIQANKPPKGDKYSVGFSGGKDSIVMAKLFELANVPYELCYSCTTIDPPEVVKFIKEHYPNCIFFFPRHTFWHGILKKGPPTVVTRWCCDVLKKEPNKLSYVYLGIRREESLARRKYQRINVIRREKKRTVTAYYPILDWTETDVWDLIDSFGLKYPSLYDEGFDRLGCIVCPFRNKYEHAKYKQRYPGMYKVFEKTITKWWYMKRAAGFVMKHGTPEEFLEAWYSNIRIKGVECSQLPFKNQNRMELPLQL